jgi:predicted flap endonuclease-1-like 5' DNA nuclease
MQEVEEFRKFLRKKGKKSHVVDDLVKRCDVFEDFLRKRKKSHVDEADKEDVLAFFDAMKDEKSGVGNYLRAISLYFKFRQKSESSTLASNLRRQKIASTRNAFEIRNFKGINPEYATRLTAAGIKDAEQMLEAGKTRTDRQKLSEKTGIPTEAILEFVKLSDLSRIEGVKNIRARLYYNAGINTVEKMAKWNPEKLQTYLTEFVKTSGFKGIAPLPKEVKHTVETAKKLPKLVEY